jgi:hypothetical protein
VIDDHPFDRTPVGRIVVTPGIVAVTEGQDRTISVFIDTPPAGTTVVDCVADDAGALFTGGALFFTEENAAVAQTVTLSGIQDWDIFDSTTTVSCSSGDLEPGVVNINLLDDDVQKILASPNAIGLGEGESRNGQVRLQFDSGTTVVAATRSGTDVMVAPTSLVFTSANYDTPQNLLLQGLIDADSTDDADTVTLSTPGAEPFVISITVRDAD